MDQSELLLGVCWRQRNGHRRQTVRCHRNRPQTVGARRDLRRSSCAIGTHAEDLHEPTLRYVMPYQQVLIVRQPHRVELARAARRQPREGPLVEVPQPHVLIFVACDNRQSGRRRARAADESTRAVAPPTDCSRPDLSTQTIDRRSAAPDAPGAKTSKPLRDAANAASAFPLLTPSRTGIDSSRASKRCEIESPRAQRSWNGVHRGNQAQRPRLPPASLMRVFVRPLEKSGPADLR